MIRLIAMKRLLGGSRKKRNFFFKLLTKNGLKLNQKNKEEFGITMF